MTTTLTASGREWYIFSATSDKPIRAEDALVEQIRQGYPPAGYGFYLFRSNVTHDGKFVATWRCATSCD